MINGYFIGYLEKYKGYMFYVSIHYAKIVETDNTIFLGNGEVNGSVSNQGLDKQEITVKLSTLINISLSTTTTCLCN